MHGWVPAMHPVETTELCDPFSPCVPLRGTRSYGPVLEKLLCIRGLPREEWYIWVFCSVLFKRDQDKNAVIKTSYSANRKAASNQSKPSEISNYVVKGANARGAALKSGCGQGFAELV